MEKVTRRKFLRSLGLAGAAGLCSPLSFDLLAAAETDGLTPLKPIKFGMIADIHRDLTPDADERLEAFMKKVEEEKPDFILSLGDFAHAIPRNEVFARRFASSESPAYHVLGNHDMDKVDKKSAVAFLSMPSPYYSFDMCGYHCVVLDPNNIYSEGGFLDYEKGNYFKVSRDRISFINDEQCEWLEDDLRETNLPTLLFSHQDLGRSIPNGAAVMRILERENECCGFRKILACFNGHHHLDYCREKNGIHYFGINSVSYLWHNEAAPGRYPEELIRENPSLDHMAIYKDPLYCFVTIDPSGRLSLHGVEGEWETFPPASVGADASPVIADRDIALL